MGKCLHTPLIVSKWKCWVKAFKFFLLFNHLLLKWAPEGLILLEWPWGSRLKHLWSTPLQPCLCWPLPFLLPSSQSFLLCFRPFCPTSYFRTSSLKTSPCPFPSKNCYCSTCLRIPWKTPFSRLCLFNLTQSLPVWIAFFLGEFVENNQRQMPNIKAGWVGGNNCGKQWANQRA